MSRTTRLLLVPAIAVFAALTLSACANPLQGLIEEGTGVTIDEGGDGVSIETEDGSINVGGSASVPDDFPSEVPLPDANLAMAIAGEASWTLNYGDMTAGDIDAFLDVFRAGGWEVLRDSEAASGTNAGFENEAYSVTLIWADSVDGSYDLVYGVQLT